MSLTITLQRPRWAGPAAAMALALLLTLAPSAAADTVSPDPPPRLFPLPDTMTAFALGLNMPLMAEDGKLVPLFYALYYDGEEGRDPLSFFFELRSSTLDLRLSQILFPNVFSTLRFLGTYTSHNAASYFYDDGRFSPDLSVNQSLAGFRLELGGLPAKEVSARLFAGVHRFILSKYVGASPIHPPPDHTQFSAGFAAVWRDVQYYETFKLKQGFETRLEGSWCYRDTSAPYGLTGEPFPYWRNAREWGFLKLEAGAYIIPTGHHNLRLNFLSGIIFDADGMSAVRVGSSVGAIPLAGAAYGEMAVDRYAFLRTDYSFDLWEGGRLALGMDIGVFRKLGGSVRMAYGFYISVTQATLFDLPICLTYGYCPEAVRPGIHGGHELMLIAKAAFF